VPILQNIVFHVDDDSGLGPHPKRREALLLTELAQKFPALEFRGEHTNVQVDAIEKIGDRNTYRAVGTRKEGFPVIDIINFDAQTRFARPFLHHLANRSRILPRG
jgi:hypothetical protein